MSAFTNIGLFNDDPETKYEQVMQLLKSAIELVQAEMKQSLQDRSDYCAA